MRTALDQIRRMVWSLPHQLNPLMRFDHVRLRDRTRAGKEILFAIGTGPLIATLRTCGSWQDVKRIAVGLLNRRRFNHGMGECVATCRASDDPTWHGGTCLPPLDVDALGSEKDGTPARIILSVR
jgi:hypothetical protein